MSPPRCAAGDYCGMDGCSNGRNCRQVEEYWIVMVSMMEYLPILLMESLCFVWPTADMNEIELLRNSRKHHGKHLWFPSLVGE
eukprot:scaffold16161_cov97-Skeletonema_menzelii.AAC.1